MNKLFAFLSGASLVLGIGLTNPRATRADSVCTNATLTGKFGGQFSGTIIAGGTLPAGLIAGNNVVNFDGKGNLSGTETLSLNGSIVPSATLSGTYNVKENCTFTLKFTDDIGESVPLSGTIVNQGKEALAIDTEPYTVITGVFKKAE